jgi:tetratricopeptide (TPR) repeat protein
MKSAWKYAALILSISILLAPSFSIAARAQIEAVPPADHTSPPQAANLIQEAIAFIAVKNLDGAKTKLDQAQALSPDLKLYWATYGNLLLKRNQNAEALTAFQKELALFPAEIVIYRSITDTQFALHQRKDAEATLHDWTVADSADPLPARKLMDLMVEDGDAAAAVTVGKDALIRLSEKARIDDFLQIELGRAEILSGDKAGGIKRIHAAMERNPDVGNTAAYVLADSGADLAAAEKITRDQINTLATIGGTWALGGNAASMRSVRDWTSDLYSMWDTLGWTLFREGKLDEARSYLSAAWLGLLSPDVGEHLAEVQQALGNKDEALRTYQLVLAVVQPDDNLGYRKALAIKPGDVQTHIQALTKAGATTTIPDPAAELVRLRTIPLNPFTQPDRHMSYIILLRDGKLVDVQPFTARTMQGVQEMFAKIDFTRCFPDAAHGTLIRTGQLGCTAGKCEIVLGLALQP